MALGGVSMSQFSKLLAQVLTTVLTALVPLLIGNQHIGPTEWVNVAIIGVGAAGVFAAPNVPGARYTKFVISALAAALAVLASAVIGGITPGEWAQIALAVLGALGVYAVPNQPTYDA